MSNILLIFPKLESKKDFHYVPFSSLCVASKLLADGHGVKILDQRVENQFYMLLDDYLPEFDEVMISAFTGYQISESYKIAIFIKNTIPDMKITLGGPHATCLSQQCLNDPLIDAVWTGYAEKGEYPMPWHLIDIKKYINPKTERFIYISSYSCVGNCRFCQTNPRRELIFLPLEKVEQDINNLMLLYPFREAVFFDSTIFTNQQRALFLSRLMKKHNLKFICDSRADEICNTDKSVLDEIISNGLKQITIGLESGSPKVVRSMNKGKNHPERYIECAKIMSKYDVIMASGVIFGCPGEDVSDIKQTIDYIKKIKEINPNFRISTTFYMPLPATEMCKEAVKHGYVEPNSLKEYAKRGTDMHYQYNKYQSSLWIKNPEEYHKIYENFVQENTDLFI